MKNISATGIFLASILMVVNCYGKIEISAGFDNSHIRSKMKIEEQGDSATITFGPANSNFELWFNHKITGVKNKKVFFKDSFSNKTAQGQPFFHVVSYKPLLSVYENGYEMMDFVKWNDLEYTYNHTFKEDTAYVSFSYIATNTMLENYINKVAGNACVKVENLGNSTFFDLPLYLLTVTDQNVPDKDKKVVFLWTREDSYEAGGTLACWGALKYLLSDDPEAVQIRKKYIYLIVPMFSRDGAKLGSTNWPMDKDGKNIIGSIQQNWPENKDKIKEVDILMIFFQNWKKAGKPIDVNHTMHCNPFGDSCLFSMPINGEFRKKLKDYFSALRKDCLPHYTINLSYDGHNLSKMLNTYWVQEYFGSIAGPIHTDSLFKKKKRPVEDNYQDGELLIRGIAEYFSMPVPESVPPFLMASNLEKYRFKKGEKAAFSVFYKDVLDRKPEYVKVVIGEKSYPMSTVSESGFIKGVEYKCDVSIEVPINDYYIEASNGVSKRRIPETYLQPGPYIP